MPVWESDNRLRSERWEGVKLGKSETYGTFQKEKKAIW